MKNKNILELCLSHGLGGLEMYVSSCYEEFSKKTVCKVVVSPDSKLDNYLDVNDKLYVKRSKFFPFISAWKLAKYIDKYEIDIVHFHWTKDIITAVLAKNMSRRKPRLVQSRHMNMTRFKDDFYHRWLYKNIDMMHAVTLQVKNQLEKFIPKDIQPKIEMVYLGVKESSPDIVKVNSIRDEYSISDTDFVVGIMGRVYEGKRQHIVIEALNKIKNPNIKLLIVGDTSTVSYYTFLQKLIQKYDLSNKVFFKSFTKNIAEYMQICDVTVSATEDETFGLVIVESMINGTPVIAVNRGGPLEIIDNTINGLTFNGTSSDLAKKIDLLYSSVKYKRKMVYQSIEHVKKKFNFNLQMNSLCTKILSLEK